MRRVAVESLGVGAAVGALTLGWFGGLGSDVVCGPHGGVFAWRVAQMSAWWAGAAPLAEDAGMAVPVAGLPWVGLGALVEPLAGPGGAWAGTLALAVGGGAAALWGLSRTAGAGVLAAALAVAVGTLPPALAAGVGDGAADLAVVPFVALALALLPRRGLARAVGFAAVLACGLADARTGAVAGLAAFAAGGGGWALLAALLAAGFGTAAPVAAGVVDPVDVAAPLLTLRPGAVAPGLAALVAVGWIMRDAGLRRAAAVAFVCALGPVLAAFGDPLTVGDAGVPLPAAFVAAFAPAGHGWTGALVVAAVAAALGLGRLPSPRWALLLAPVAVLEALAVTEAEPACVTLDAPVAVRALAERKGGVLNLPVAVESDLVAGAPAAAHGLYLVQRRLHGRPLATGPEPLGASDPLFGEPAVVLSLGADKLLMPPNRPGDVLRGLGVTEIVVHRRLFEPGALALVDPVLIKLYGAPQRDHAGDVDLYRVNPDGPARLPTAETLHGADDAPPPGWLDVGSFLAGLSGAPGAPAGGAGAPGPRAGGPDEAGPPDAGSADGAPAAGAAPDRAAGAAPDGAAPAAGGAPDGAVETPQRPPRKGGPRRDRPRDAEGAPDDGASRPDRPRRPRQGGANEETPR